MAELQHNEVHKVVFDLSNEQRVLSEALVESNRRMYDAAMQLLVA